MFRHNGGFLKTQGRKLNKKKSCNFLRGLQRKRYLGLQKCMRFVVKANTMQNHVLNKLHLATKVESFYFFFLSRHPWKSLERYNACSDLQLSRGGNYCGRVNNLLPKTHLVLIGQFFLMIWHTVKSISSRVLLENVGLVKGYCPSNEYHPPTYSTTQTYMTEPSLLAPTTYVWKVKNTRLAATLILGQSLPFDTKHLLQFWVSAMSWRPTQAVAGYV